MLFKVKAYLQAHHHATLRELSDFLHEEPTLVKHMLTLLVRKGCVQCRAGTVACQLRCKGCALADKRPTMYFWID